MQMRRNPLKTKKGCIFKVDYDLICMKNLHLINVNVYVL